MTLNPLIEYPVISRTSWPELDRAASQAGGGSRRDIVRQDRIALEGIIMLYAEQTLSCQSFV